MTSSAGSTYAPGQVQALTITITDSRARVYGFQMSARPDSDNSNGQAGSFTATSEQIVVCDNLSPRATNGCPASTPVQFIQHRRPYSTNTITVAWISPSSDVGPVTIYVAANAANGDGNLTGDHIYTGKLQLTAAAPAGDVPLITAGGVVSASAFDAKAGVAPGTWLEIFGTNLGTSTRTWQSSDFNGDNAPLSLDGVSVTIGGKSAYVDFVSPGQVNVQVPDGIPIGAGVPLVMKNSQGETDAFALQTSDLAPALLAPASFVVKNKSNVVATFPPTASGNLTFVGAIGAISGVNTRPAKPGEVITLYGVGFGPVSPTTSAGVINTKATSLTNPITILFGQTPATVTYAGLAPNFVGLYQINVKVPNLSASDWPVTVQVGGVTLMQNVFITTSQ